MDGISSLQPPRAGRSRFSKALPTPPEFDGRTQTTQTNPRELPDEPPAPPPPKKNSTLITSPSTISLRSKIFDSPLPFLPIMAEPPRPRAQAGPIARKPVAQLPTPPASVGLNTKTNAAKRKSSISSLLSAYSRSSSDWAQRSSHESDFTKESEPSYSPEREDLGSLPPVPSKESVGIVNDTTSDKASEVTSYTIIDSFPPPPPLKDPSRPRTPSSTVRSTDGFKEGDVESTSLSPESLRSGSPRAGREIWRRRASSKSDASLVIAELKLPSSNGSTASTSHPPPKKAEPSSLLPPLPANIDISPALPLPPPSKQHQQSSATLPPRTASLPGRNIRPIKKIEPSDQHNKMGNFSKLSKLRGLLKGGDSDDDSDTEPKREQNRLQKALLKKSSKNDNKQHEPQKNQNTPDINGNTEADKPEPPAKDNLMQQQRALANASATAAAGASLLPASSVDASAPPPSEPPSESGKATSTGISRRPVGAAPVRNLNQPESQVEPEKKNTTSLSIEDSSTQTPNVEHSSFQTPGTLQPINPVGSLPHPRQRYHPSQRGLAPNPPSAYSQPPLQSRGPTSPVGRSPRSVSTPAQPNQSPSSAAPMTGLHRAPGAITTDSPISQPQFSTLVSPRIGEGPRKETFSAQELIASPRVSPAALPNAAFLTQPLPPANERETTTRDSGFDAGTVEEKYAAEQPMSDAAAAAIALFPVKQNWNVECTVDGVWPSNPLCERHYSCHVNHSKLLDSRNTYYPLACQTCGVADAERRFMCAFCNVRICMPCADLLVANGRNLKVVMAMLKAQNRIRDWDQYPKRGTQEV
ncbi:hypothetical protein GGR58DRAFT_302896 [Xylaria digitata]|nr:hypothetical protein GGR58DRAFT_302896 [Xylaria digitata]